MDFLTAWLGAVPGFMTPLLLASTGLILCERAGVLNLGSEGLMALGAMAGAWAMLSGHGAAAALLIGGAAGLALGLPFIACVVLLRAPQIIAGLGIVAIGLGASAWLGRDIAHRPFAGLANLSPPAALVDIPLIGPMLFKQDAMVYASIAIALASAAVLGRTYAGLRLRAVGEDPATADSVGVPVKTYQALAVALGCVLVGVAGAYLSVAGSRVWTDGMVAGRGWIALALVVFARWSPGRAIAGALLFGGTEALIPRLQATGIEVPVYLLSMVPYLLTILVLAVTVGAGRIRSAEPAALGSVYVRQDR